jgi:hypothetical protein
MRLRSVQFAGTYESQDVIIENTLLLPKQVKENVELPEEKNDPKGVKHNVQI